MVGSGSRLDLLKVTTIVLTYMINTFKWHGGVFSD